MQQHHDKNNEYAWDQTGEPDPLISRLEQTLAPVRFDPDDGGKIDLPGSTSRAWLARPRNAVALALAASVVFLWSINAMFFSGPSRSMGWAVTQVTGTLSLGDTLPVSQWLETDAQSSVRLAVADLGYVDVQPESRIRIRKNTRNEQRMELASGKIDAVITAPPRLFLVDTPAALAVDLGCAYTLEVDDDGDGELIVRAGWVNLETEDGLVSTVPSGGHCKIASDRGPGTPYFPDASKALLDAVAKFDTGAETTMTDMLDAARPRDTLTLWHLFQRVDVSQRKMVLDRVRTMVPESLDGINPSKLYTLDAGALESWRVNLRPTWR